MSSDRAQEVALFRYRLAREAADEALSARERGQLVRALVAREHLGPDGTWVRVSRSSLDRWISKYRQGGYDALVPTAKRVEPKTPARLLELACALRREQPARTAAQIQRLILEAEGWAPNARTLQRHLAAARLHWRGQQPVRAFGRFEADRPNLLWTGDALHGPRVGGRTTVLVCVHRRPQPSAGRLSVGDPRGRPERVARAARRPRVARRPGCDLCR